MCCIGIGKARLIKMLADQEAAQINSPQTREPATAQITSSNNKHSSTEECETLPEESTASQSSSPTSSSESPNPGQPRKEETPQHLASNSSQTCSQGANLSLEHQHQSPASIMGSTTFPRILRPTTWKLGHPLQPATSLNSHLPSILQPASSGTSLLPSSTPIPSTYRPVLPCIHTSHTFHDGRCSFQLNLPGGEILLLLPQMS